MEAPECKYVRIHVTCSLRSRPALFVEGKGVGRKMKRGKDGGGRKKVKEGGREGGGMEKSRGEKKER